MEFLDRQPDDKTSKLSGRQNNTGLPDTLKAGIEHLSNISLDDVNVHFNSSKPAQFQALAYTQGSEIHVGPGQEKHLPHEAWHVVQQKQGRVTPTLQAMGVTINDDQSLEREADTMGSRALEGASQPAQLRNTDAPGPVLQRKETSFPKDTEEQLKKMGALQRKTASRQSNSGGGHGRHAKREIFGCRFFPDCRTRLVILYPYRRRRNNSRNMGEH